MENFPYVKTSFPVACAGGIYADAATGRRLSYYPDTGLFEPYIGNKPKHVKRRTLSSYYTSLYYINGSALTYAIYQADEINKHGLVWTPSFTLTLSKGDTDISSDNAEKLKYWIKGEGSNLLTPGLLRSPTPTPSLIQCFKLLWPALHTTSIPFADVETMIFTMCLSPNREDIKSYLSQEKLRQMKSQRFGVELEFTGMTRSKAAQVIARYFGSRQVYHTSSWDAYCTYDSKNRKWTVKRDGSIRAQQQDGSLTSDPDYRCELVTPILEYDDIPMLQQVIRELRKKGKMRVNDSCGLHVHVDNADHTVESLTCLVKMMAAKEPLLYRALDVYDHRMSYCKMTEQALVQSLRDAKPMTETDLKLVWCRTSTRYHGLNLSSMYAGKGLEFRLFNATRHAGKVKAYIQLCLALSNHAKYIQRACTASRSHASDLVQMRAFMVQLGLTGPEFKTARLHLTSHLKTVNDSMAA